jgi:peptidoglycan/xylan/chitin deacetylase (PgdA/CDA1 family)
MLQKLIKITQKNKIYPFYHLVTDKNPDFIKHLYTPKTTNEFKRDLNIFLHYFESVSLSQTILTNISETKDKKATFHLTFDDGLSNFYHVIAPILLEKNIHATVFLNTAFIDNKDLFYRYKASLLIEEYLNSDTEKKQIFKNFIAKHTKSEAKNVKQFLLTVNYANKNLLDQLAKKTGYCFNDFLQKEKPYLSTQQIKELQQQGFTFGAHSINHPIYQNLSLEQQIRQTTESLKTIKEKFNTKNNSFAFPFHDIGISRDFFEQLQDKIDISFGVSQLKDDEIPWSIQRLDMEKNTGNTKNYLLKNYLKLYLQQKLGKDIIKRN